MMKTKMKLIAAGVIALAVVAAIGVPSYQHARRVAQRNMCLSNLQQINSIQVCCVSLEQKLAFGDTMDAKYSFQFLKGGICPVCPAGGEYVISWVVGGPYPKCSVHGDILQETYGNREFREGIRRKPTGSQQRSAVDSTNATNDSTRTSEE